ncbi:MAG: hypothetical protein GX640_07645 [Fibrobacter sp.]|nr:hypothetical protein [Fibrobacter sp.]
MMEICPRDREYNQGGVAMHRGEEKRDALLEFIDCKILDPILEAKPEFYSTERERRSLIKVKKQIAQEKESFHSNQLTSQQIYKKYFRQVFNESHYSLGRELEDLELPRFLEVKEQFIQYCKELDI